MFRGNPWAANVLQLHTNREQLSVSHRHVADARKLRALFEGADKVRYCYEILSLDHSRAAGRGYNGDRAEQFVESIAQRPIFHGQQLRSDLGQPVFDGQQRRADN